MRLLERVIRLSAKMSSNPTARQLAEGPWRLCSISPRRPILEALAPVLTECFPSGNFREIHSYPSAEELTRELTAQVPDVCFVDAITDSPAALDLFSRILRINSRINVIALLAADQPGLILKSLRMGATEFVMQPFTTDQLLAALPKLSRKSPDPRDLGKVYCVVPVKGACGASTVACNLAFRWKRSAESKRVLLADMDPLCGTMSFLLKLKSTYSFIDALQRADTLDADLWRAMVTPSGGVDVLLAPELLVHGINEVQDASPVVEFARRHHGTVILDAGNAYGPWNLSLARASDEVLLVTTNELPALHAAQRALAYLEAKGIGRWQVRLVVNRYDKRVGLEQEAVASALHIDLLHTLPSAYDTLQKALMEGKPVAPGSALGKEFSALADKLTGRSDKPAPRAAPFGGFLSLFSRTFS